jgi:ABC-type transport system substrate-binding protein
VTPSQDLEYQSLRTGPYVDGIQFKVIDDSDQMLLELQSGTIEMHSGFLSEAQVQSLVSADPNITADSVMQNGYGVFTINCRDYPLNISALRRAFALAFDKDRVKNDVFNGSTAVHDSLIPIPNEFCIEDDLPYHYYDANFQEGNAILDAAGFEVDGGTGWRKAPNGQPFNITVEYDPVYRSWSADIANVAVDALQSLFIDAQSLSGNVGEFLTRLGNQGDYDMVLMEFNFQGDPALIVADDFHSDNAGIPFGNDCNFINTSFDFYSDQIQQGATHEEIFAAASAMQLILHEQVPQLACYTKVRNQAYRTDLFTEHTTDLVNGVSNSWTLRQIRSIGGSPGGVVSVGISEDPDSFNMFVTERYSRVSYLMMDLLNPSLYDRNPTLKPIGDLATNLTVQRNVDNPDVPSGHTRYIIDIIENATWSDGTPLTANDVNFTFQLVINHQVPIYGGEYLPMFDTLSLVATDVPSPYRIVMDFDTESYFDFSRFAFGYIIPEHIFRNETTTLSTWNPVFDPEAPLVTCGPFLMDDFEVNQYYSLVRNPEFYYALNRTGTIPTGPTTPRPWVLLTYVAIGVSLASILVIITVVFLTRRHKKSDHTVDYPPQEPVFDERIEVEKT